jgi:hypothetical protein
VRFSINFIKHKSKKLTAEFKILNSLLTLDAIMSSNTFKQAIYTIGHSTHQPEYFLELLQAYGVNCIIDVRSIAASAYNPQYNKEPLSNFLKNNKVKYLHFAEEFGARHTDPDLLDDEGKVDFERCIVLKKVDTF